MAEYARRERLCAERRREKASGRARRWSGTARCGCSEPAAGAAKAGSVAGGATGSRWGPEVASAWSARAARPPRPRTATCGRSPGSRSSSRRGGSGASSITGGLGVQQQRSKRGKKLGCYFDCRLSRHTVLGPAGKLAGGRAQRVGATPTGWAPRLGPSARGPRRRAAPGAHDAPPRGADAPPRSRWFGTKNTRRPGGGPNKLHHRLELGASRCKSCQLARPACRPARSCGRSGGAVVRRLQVSQA